jgi:hypothetical protein
VDPAAPWEAQVRQAIEAWIAAVGSRRAVMLSWIRDVPALAMKAHPLQRDAMESTAITVEDGGRFSAITEEAVAAAIALVDPRH